MDLGVGIGRGKERGANIGTITLGDLRKELHKDEEQLQRLKRQLATKREKEKVEELRNLKVTQQKVRARQRAEDKEIHDLILELEKRKEKELRLRMKQEKIKAELQRIDQVRLGSLEQERKRELEALAKQKQAIEAKEATVMRDIEMLEKRISEQEREFREKYKKVDEAYQSSQQKAQNEKDHKQQQIKLALARGERAAMLKLQRERLLSEKKRIAKRIVNRGRGDDAADISSEESMKASSAIKGGKADVKKLRQCIVAAEDRLKKMKEDADIDEARLEQRSRAMSREVGKLLDEHGGASSSNGNSSSGPFSRRAEKLISEAENSTTDVPLAGALDELDKIVQETAEKNASARPARKNDDASESSPKRPEKKSPTRKVQEAKSPINQVPEGPPSMEEVEQLKREYFASGRNDPELWSQIAQLEREAAASMGQPMPPHAYGQYPQHGYPSMPQPFPHYPGMPHHVPGFQHAPRMAGYGQGVMGGHHPPHPTHGQMPHMAGAPPAQDFAGFERALEKMTSRLGSLVNGDGRRHDRHHGHHHHHHGKHDRDKHEEDDDMLHFIEKQTAAFQTLQSIPPNSALYAMQMNHLEMVSRLKFEADALKQKQKLQEIKHDLKLKEDESRRKREHDELVAQQRRDLIAARLRKAIVKESASKHWGGSNSAYDAQDGFSIYFDFCMGLSRSCTGIKLVYSFFEGEVRKTQPRSLALCETEISPDGATTLCVCAARRSFQRVGPNPNLRVVVEVQEITNMERGSSMNVMPKYKAVGWTSLRLFRTNTTLMEGPFKLPLIRSPIDVHVLKGKPQPIDPRLCLYMRCVKAADSDEAAAFAIDPAVTSHLYGNPDDARKQRRGTRPSASRESARSMQADHKVKKKPAGSTRKLITTKIPEEDEVGTRASSRSSDSRTRASATPMPPAGNTVPIGVRIASSAFPKDMLPQGTVCIRVTVHPNGESVLRERDEGKFDQVVVAEDDPASFRSAEVAPAPSISFDDEAVFQDLAPSKDAICIVEALEHVDIDEPKSRERYGWGYFYLWEGEVAKRRQVVLTLTEADVSLPYTEKMEALEIKGAQVVIDIFDPSNEEFDDEDRKGDDVARRAPSVGRKTPSPDLPQKKPSLRRQDTTMSAADIETPRKGSGEQPFYPVAAPLDPRPPPFRRGDDGFDVYVDQARYLPDNATISKIQMKAFTHDLKQVGATGVAFPKLDDTAGSPKYSLRAEFRGEDVANPALTLLLRVDTVNKFTGKEASVVGYAAINVFKTTDASNNQPRSTDQEFALNKGAFQVPLMRRMPDKSAMFTVESFTAGARKVPCATLLVRIVPAARSPDDLGCLSTVDYEEHEWERLGLVVPPPAYSSEVYDSTRAMPLPCEYTLYEARKERESASVREVALDVVDPDRDNISVDMLSEDDEAMKEYIQKRLEKPKGILETARMATYDSVAGFKFAVEMVHNLVWGFRGRARMVKAIYCLSPPAGFYEEPKLTEDTLFTLAHDWEASTSSSRRFLDGEQSFRDVPFDPNLLMVIDVKQIGSKKNPEEILDHSWTVCPIFQSPHEFTRHGYFQLPLYEGKPSLEMLNEMQNEPPLNVLQRELSKGKASRLQYKKGNPSVIVKIVDNSISDCLPTNIKSLNTPMSRAMTEVLGTRLKNYKYDPSNPPSDKKFSKSAAKLMPKGTSSVEEYETSVNQKFATAAGISHYHF